MEDCLAKLEELANTTFEESHRGCIEILERIDNYYKNLSDEKAIVAEMTDDLHNTIASTVDSQFDSKLDIYQLIEMLKKLHADQKLKWEESRDWKAQLLLREEPLKEKICELKSEIDGLKQENKRLNELKKESHPHLSTITKLMGVEYKQNPDLTITHLSVKTDNGRHKVSSFDEFESAIFDSCKMSNL